MKNKFQLWKRGKFWYYRIAGETSFHSTGLTGKMQAIDSIYRKLEKAETDVTFESYAENFYVWGKCDWIQRQNVKGKPFSESMAKMRRAHLNNYLFPTFGDKKLHVLNAVEIENWLVSLKLSNSTRNHILYSLNIILKEAKREKLIAELVQ